MKVTIEISDEDLLHLKLWWTHDNEDAFDEVYSWFCHNVAPVVVAASEGETNGG